MNSHERITAVLEGGAPDRVPMMEQSVAPSVASAILGRKALTGTTALHCAEAKVLLNGDDDAYTEFIHRVLDDRADFARAMGYDVLTGPWLLGARPSRQLDELTFLYGDLDADWTVRRFDAEAHTFQVVDTSAGEPPLDEMGRQVREVEEVAENPQPPTDWFARLTYMQQQFGEEFEIVGGGGLGIPLAPAWLEATITRPDLVDRLLAARVEIHKPSLKAQAESGVRIVWAGGDLAGNLGPMYSPRTFRELMVPHMKELTGACHALGMKYLYRTDGNLWPLGDDFFLHTGTDGYGEIDGDAGMDVCEVHAKYPHLVLWGGVACGSVLHRGTVDDVKEAVRHAISGTGGRLILGSSNAIVHGTPPENIIAMAETAIEMGSPTQGRVGDPPATA